jgi:hypothetical protein
MKKQLTSTLLAASMTISAIASAASPDFAFNPNKGTYNKGEQLTVSYSISGMARNASYRVRSYWTYEHKASGRRWTSSQNISPKLTGNASFMSRTRVPSTSSDYYRYKFHIDVVHAADSRIIYQTKTTSIGVK